MQITRDAAAWAVACETTSVAAGSGEAAKLALLHDRLGDPVDARVAADRRVRRVDEDNLVVLVRGILHGGSRERPQTRQRSARHAADLVDPVRVQHAKVAAALSDALLSLGAQVAAPLQVVDTLVLGLAVDNALRVRALAATTAHAHAVDHVALLGLVSEAAGLVRAGGAGRAVHDRQLAARGEPSDRRMGWYKARRREYSTHRYSQHRTRRRKRSTSDCFFL
jgi:hypothetical protein